MFRRPFDGQSKIVYGGDGVEARVRLRLHADADQRYRQGLVDKEKARHAVGHRRQTLDPRTPGLRLDPHRLADARTRLDSIGVGAALRIAVGLEGGVAEVALVLHLERLALHLDFDLVAGELDRDADDLTEGPAGLDEVGEASALAGAVGVSDLDRLVGEADGVEDAESCAVRREPLLGPPFVGERDLLRSALDTDVRHIRHVVAEVVSQGEAVFARLDRHVRHLRREGAPMLVPQGGVDPSNRLRSVRQFEVADRADGGVELHRERPGGQGDHRRGRRVAAEDEAVRIHVPLWRTVGA